MDDIKEMATEQEYRSGRFEFRAIRPEEAEEAAAMEEICFPPNEVVCREDMIARIEAAPEMFLVAVDNEKNCLAGLLTGLSTDEDIFRDEFFSDPSLYDPDGKNVMLLGLEVIPEYRNQGIASALMNQYKTRSREKGRKALYLTCLDNMVPVYERMGFADMGESASSFGGEKWHDMKCDLN